MTLPSSRGGLRLVHTAHVLEARRSLERPAGYYRRDPMPRPRRRMWFVNFLHRCVPVVGYAVLVVLITLVAWLFGVVVFA